MKIVSTIRRISLLRSALDRVPLSHRYDAIWLRLYNKWSCLTSYLYTISHIPGYHGYLVRKQIKTAHRLLNVPYCPLPFPVNQSVSSDLKKGV